MLLTQNSGKRFTRKWQEDRAKALVDSTRFTAAELAYLEVTASDGRGVNDPHTYQVVVTPVDPETRGEKGKYDMRKKGEYGGY